MPESDPRLLTRAVLGLYNSVWHWYRPGETFTLAGVGQFIVEPPTRGPRLLARPRRRAASGAPPRSRGGLGCAAGAGER